MKTISSHLCEIRLKPNPKFLDKRGNIASSIISEDFPSWVISENKINFSNKSDDRISAFFTYLNLGVSIFYPHKPKDFINITERFINKSWNFFQNTDIVRIGIRSKMLIDLGKNFNDYFKFYEKNINLFSEQNTFKAKLVDVGLNLNYADKDNFFNITTGPMEKEQAKIFFDNKLDDELPKNALYLEIDYFKEDFAPFIKQKDILKIINNGIEKAEEVKKSIINSIDNK
jgi:hypothetical protein